MIRKYFLNTWNVITFDNTKYSSPREKKDLNFSIRMRNNISLFNDYHVKENILSNHCGVILKLLYEENPRSFEEVIATLSGQDFMISPAFKQQIKRKESVPDIVIEQKSFTIFFETKRFDWFYENQIDRHLKGFNKGTDFNILFLLSNFEEDNPEDHFEATIRNAQENYQITLCPISFEKFLGVIENVEASLGFKKYVEEFGDFLDRNNYLPSWKYYLNIVNCAGTIHEIHKYNVYMCPNTGGKYRHRRAMFFGGYKSKNVRFIHEIKALVVIERGGLAGRVAWKNDILEEDKELIQEAKSRIELFDYRKREILERDIQVFLLQNPHEVNYRKSSDGGLYSSKKYINHVVKESKAENSTQLANFLKNKSWE